MTEAEEVMTWAMCAMAGGAGRGKCDPELCACGGEARLLIAELNKAGYVIAEIVHKDPVT